MRFYDDPEEEEETTEDPGQGPKDPDPDDD